MPAANHDVTELLEELSSGNRDAMGQLMPLVYDQLRKLAAVRFERERGNHTLQPTALVHEAYLRLVDQRRVRWQNRAHFIGVAAQLMRRILIDHARGHDAIKRGGLHDKVTISDEVLESAAPDEASGRTTVVDVLALDDALARLTAIDAQQGRIVELRFFGGLTVEETAQVLGISPATVKREWRLAKVWLHREMREARP
jgi:RNA polymerase sigma-70 factor (ECF subfamily)